jgi:1-acyl-sn-glycerol-3-phosphate acyltransferase
VADWFFHPGAAICGFLARVLFSARAEGLEHVPRSGAYILVANHCSNVDPAIIGWAVGNGTNRVIHFMAKAEIQQWPFVGWLASKTGAIFVRRGEGDRAAQRAALEALKAGEPVALFIEGTRSRDGHLKAGRGGAAFLAMRTGAPLLPVGISGTHRIFPGGSRFPHATRVVVRVGETISIPHEPAGRLDREALAASTETIISAIEELLPPDQRRLP